MRFCSIAISNFRSLKMLPSRAVPLRGRPWLRAHSYDFRRSRFIALIRQ